MTDETNETIVTDGSTVANDNENSITSTGGGFGAPEAKLDAKIADAHRTKIVGVTTKTSETTGNTGILIQHESLDTGVTSRDLIHAIYPGIDFFNPENWTADGFNTAVLSDVPPEGKKQSPRQTYARNGFNSKGTGEIQRYVAVAEKQGKTPAALGLPTPSSPDEFIAALNAVLTDVEGIAVRKPEVNADPKFDGELKIKSFVEPEARDNPKAQGLFKGVRKMWE